MIYSFDDLIIKYKNYAKFNKRKKKSFENHF